eukprot:8347375-Karenia_brevis.AAC.1
MVGGLYLPGPSDPRFRSLQGAGKRDQFALLDQELLHLGGTSWLLGGDMNAITDQEQPSWEQSNPLDPTDTEPELPRRVSDDRRPISPH